LDMEVKQNVDTMLYNATDMVIAYEKNTWKRKDITDFFRQKETKEYVELLENLNTGNPVFKIMRGKYWGTRMNQELLLDFMMRLSVEFKHHAITFILEWLSLAWKRHTIKEGYKRMTQAISESWSANYRDEATLINVLVSGSPASNQRARYDEDKMTLTDRLQDMNAWLIKAWLSLEERKNILIKSI
jgi:hypothetical protein